MRRQFVFPLSILCAVLLLVGRTVDAQDKEKDAKSKKSIVAVFSLDGPITEKPQADDFPFGEMNAESLKDLVGRMNQAAKDDEVQAAVILLGNATVGMGQIEELRDAMSRLKQAGKPVHAHADVLSMHQYVLWRLQECRGDVHAQGSFARSG